MGENEEQQNNDVEESSSSSSLDHQTTSLTHRLVDRIRQLVGRVVRKHSKQQKVAVGLLLTMISVVACYHKRRRLQRFLPRRPAYWAASEAPLSLIYRTSREGSIERALLGSAGIYFLSSGVWKKASLPASSTEIQKELFQLLSESCDNVEALPESITTRLATPLLAALPFVYLGLVYRLMHNMTGKEGGLARSCPQSSVSTTFSDVAGMEDVVVEVKEVVAFLKDTEHYSRLGARIPRGILLHGPPGSGKTLLAQAVAGESSVDCFMTCSASDFVELYVGRGAARVRSLFTEIRRKARSKYESWWHRWFRGSTLTTTTTTTRHRQATAILFIDELDALAKTRSQWNNNDEREQTLNALLTEMDGFASQKTEEDVIVIVMAASNRVDVLDPAILRRFERQIYVGYPDADGRNAILQTHAKRIPWNQQTVDWAELARDTHTADFSGADIRNMINEAAVLATREGCSVVDKRHLEHAARRIREMKNAVKQSARVLPVMLR